MTRAFSISDGEWLLILDGVIVRTSFNSKGAAEAAIKGERFRRLMKLHLDFSVAEIKVVTYTKGPHT